MSHETKLSILDFSSYITERTRDFTGREWVFAEIDRWLKDPEGPSFFVITGEPGIGKSAIAARLTQIKDLAAYHFCIAREVRTITPTLFARSLSQQLCHIDSFALGILKDSNIDLKPVQNVQANYGQVIGAKIETLVINAPSGSAAFSLAVLEPLRNLYSDGFSQQVILLVDALDEAMQYKGSESIVDLLANMGELPRQVRLVLTSRPEGNALRHFEERQIPHFCLDAGQLENLEDIRRYVYNELEKLPGLRMQLAERHLPAATFVEQITTASGGNFLYVVWLLRDLATGTRRFDALGELPRGLNGIYREFLRTRRVGEDRQGWRTLYRPILAVLVAAQAPLTAQQVTQFTELSPQDVDDGLQDLSQFLDSASAGEGRYFLYHQSINDWLQKKEDSREFWIDVIPVHQRIVRYYRQNTSSWDDVDWDGIDLYGLNHLASHLFALRSDPDYRQQLYGLACRSVMVGKHRRTGTHRAFAADLDLALKAAASAEKPPNLVELVRGSLIYATLGSLATNVPPEVLGVLARVGQVGIAQGYAALMQDPKDQSRAYLLIGEALLGQGKVTTARAMLERAWTVRETAYDKSDTLGDVARILAQAGEFKLAMEAMQDIAFDDITTFAQFEVSVALAKAGEFDLALKAAEVKEEISRADMLSEVAIILAQAGKKDRAIKVAKQVLEQGAELEDYVLGKDPVLSKVTQALAQAGEFDLALKTVSDIRFTDCKAKALSEIALSLSQAGEKDRAIEQVRKARNAVDEISWRDLDNKPAAQSNVAQALAIVGELTQALKVIEGIESGSDRACALGQVGLILAKSEQADGAADIAIKALKMAETAESYKEDTLSEVARTLAQTRDLNLLLTAAEALRDKYDRSSVLSTMAMTLVQTGEKDIATEVAQQALSVAQEIDDIEHRYDALSKAARSLAGAGMSHLALTVTEEITDRYCRVSAQSGIAQVLAQAGEKEKAAAASLRALAAATEIEDREYEVQASIGVAKALDQVGEKARAIEVAEQALETVKDIGVSYDDSALYGMKYADTLMKEYQVAASSSVAQFLAQIGAREKAIEIADEITRQIALVKGEPGLEAYVARGLREAAQILVRAKEKERAAKVIRQAQDAEKTMLGESYHHASTEMILILAQVGSLDLALEMVQKYMYGQTKVETLSDMAAALAQTDDVDGVEKVAELALVAVEEDSAPNAPVIATRLAQVAQALSQAGDNDRAREIARSALEMAVAIREPAAGIIDGLQSIWEHDMAVLLSDVARVLANVELPEEANAAVQQALTTAETIEDEAYKARGLSKVVQALTQTGQSERTWQILPIVFATARLARRETVFEVLQNVATTLAVIDQGQTLWRVYQAVMGVEGWWSSQ